MTARIERQAVAPARPVSLGRRLYGLGSLYGKTVRDSRRAFLIVAALLVAVILIAAAGTAAAFNTVATRREAAALAATLPSMFQGMLGRQVGLDTLGGIIEWRYPTLFFLIAPIWSILALSGTLATEASRGSLEYLGTTPLTRRRIAVEKVLSHLTMVVLLTVVVALATWVVGKAFATLPGDDIPFGAAVGFAVLVGLSIVAAGSIAFAAAPFLGRGASAGVAAVALVAMYVITGYRTSVPLFETLSPLSWYSWTANHVPLAGLYDWPSLVPIAAITVALLVIGVVAFERRDIGSTVALRSLGFPRATLGVSGPASRSLGDRLPAAVAWGIGMGLYALTIATTGEQMAASLKQVPRLDEILKALYPTIDYTTPAGVLELAFVQFATVAIGFAAAQLVAGWASDESAGRLEVVLSHPVSRTGWVIRSGLGVFAAIAVLSALIAGGIAIGAASVNGDAVTPARGMIVVALFAMSLAGIGMAVGGLVRPSLAAPVVAGVILAMFLIELFAIPLKLPDVIHEVSLISHLGQPMVGVVDLPGIVAFVVLAFGGLGLGAWGLGRRDLRD